VIRDIDNLEQNMGWSKLDLMDARIRRKKGNYPGHAGYRQRGRGEARIAKRQRAKMRRRLGALICEHEFNCR
jgi:hypothetical protein